MTRALIQQVRFIPIVGVTAMILTGLLLPGYSSMMQHMSEIGMMDHPAARVMHVSAIAGGTSIVLFAIALALHPLRCFRFSAVAAVIFGAGYLSGGVFHSGPLHGLYGATMFYVLVPVFFALELPDGLRDRSIVRLSLLASLLSLLYMWFLLSGLEPMPIRGLSQRIGAFIIFGWYPFAAAWLLRISDAPHGPRSAATLGAA